jgi:GNAT superfamily N-acetyltransferase
VIIRRLTAADDLSGAIHLLQRFFREEGFSAIDDIIAQNTSRMATIDACAIIVAEHEGRAVGVATLSMDFGIEYGWSGEMGDLYIVPEWRGQGLSKSILAAVEQFARNKGAAGYSVTVTPFALKEHGLTEFYSHLGFANEGRMILWRTYI